MKINNFFYEFWEIGWKSETEGNATLLQRGWKTLCDCVFLCWTPTELVSYCVNAGLPRSLYILVWMCVSMLDSHWACVYLLAWMFFHAGLPQGLYMYILVWMCVSMLDSQRACKSSCVNVFPRWAPEEEGKVVKTS